MVTCKELEKLMENDKCRKCEFYHTNQGEVTPELKHYCFFASVCLSESEDK